MTVLIGKALPRRTVLRGLGASLSLPLLDAMLPAFSSRASAATTPAHRFLAFYVPNGMAMEVLDPEGRGARLRALADPRTAGAVQEPDAGAVRHQRELELHPRRRIGIVPDRHDTRRTKRGRDSGRRLDGPAPGQALRQRDAGRIARARAWTDPPMRAPAPAS